MQELPETNVTLLRQIQDSGNRAAWEEFVGIYRPVVYRLAISHGLQHADALDLVQTVFIAIANADNLWEKQSENSRFRYWLLRIAKNATLNALTRRPRDRAVGAVGDEIHIAEGRPRLEDYESHIDWEYRRQLYLQASEQVRETTSASTWQAFELTAVRGMTVEEAAAELGKSVGAIYAARSRMMKQLSEIVLKLEASYE